MNANTTAQMDMGDIVARAFGLYRRAPLRWIALTVPLFVVALIGSLLLDRVTDVMTSTQWDQQQLLDALPWTGPVSVALLLASALCYAALVSAAGMTMRGGTPSIAHAYAVGGRVAPSAFAVLLLGVVLLTLGAATILLLPVVVFFLLGWSLFLQVRIIEGVGVWRSLGRSRQIVRGQWWRTFLITLAVLLLAILPTLALSPAVAALDASWANALGSAAANALALPFIALAQTVLYGDLRTRKGERPFLTPRVEEAA